jgi:lipoate---protein ligase
MGGCGVKCRFMDTGERPAYINMALDEAIMTRVSEGGSPPTLRFYSWRPKAVSIGYFQGIREEVDLDECFRDGVDVVRRITGGGAVYHDAELTYSYVAPESAVPDGILESYRLICSGLVAGLKNLGCKAEFAPLNDVVVGGRKVSGNAQTRRMGCVLAHGTVLLKVDADAMFKYLLVPKEKIREKAVSDVKSRVTSLTDVLRKETTYSKAAEALRKGFASALKLELRDSAPAKEELSAAAALAENKYSTLDWNGRR